MCKGRIDALERDTERNIFFFFRRKLLYIWIVGMCVEYYHIQSYYVVNVFQLLQQCIDQKHKQTK